MSDQEKLAMLEEIMDIDEGSLTPDDILADYPEWDSIATLSYIAMLDSDFHKMIKGDVVKAFIKVQDAMDLME